MKKYKITIGADPEVFVYNTVKQEVVSVEGLIALNGEGTKENPLFIDKGCSLQEDNVLAEYNIPPCSTLSSWVEYHNYMIDTLNTFLPNDHSVLISSSEILKAEYLKSKQAREAGCASEESAYDLSTLKSPDLKNTRLRTCGGHIHVGIQEDLGFKLKFIKLMDLFLGVPSLLLDSDDRRRQLYGQPGAFRLKEYGFEYRCLSNFWIKNENLQKWAFNQVIKVLDNINMEIDSNLVYNTIVSNDKKVANQLINYYTCVESTDILEQSLPVTK